jgi:uncharacterized protein involved in exopolysaccharide biosynthesis
MTLLAPFADVGPSTSAASSNANGGFAAVLLEPSRLKKALLGHRRLVLAWIAAFLVLGGIAALVIPSRYTATAVVLIDPRTPRVMRSEEVLQGIGNDTAAVESQVEFFTSTAMAAKIIKQFDLMNDPEFNGPSMTSQLQAFITGEAPSDNLSAEKAIERFMRSLLVKRVKLTYVIEVNFVSKSRAKAAAIANAIVDAYIADQKATKVSATGEASEQLGGRLEDLRSKVRTAEQAIADFKAANKIVSVGPGTSNEALIQRQAEAISSQLMAARVRVSETAANLDQLRTARRDGATDTLTASLRSTVMTTLRVQIAVTARRVAQLEETLGPAHPELRAARRQLKELKGEAEAELSRITRNVEVEHRAALDYEHRLADELSRLQVDAAAYDQSRVKLQDLQREALANNTLYAQLLNRSKDTAEQANVQRADARVISRAITPVRANPPSPLLILALAGLLGCAVGSVAAVRSSLKA